MVDFRQTKQKQVIESEISKFSSFFTGEELFKSVKKIDPKIGIATIYRSLKSMRDKELIHSYNCDKKTVYSKSKDSHCHFICEKCHAKTHIKIENIDFFKQGVSGKICHFQIDIYGICRECVDYS